MMRTSYVAPSVLQFDSLFSRGQFRGGALSDIKVFKPEYHHNRGGSLFGILGNIFRRTIPFLTNYVLPEAGNFARNIAGDYQNVPLRRNVKRNLIKSMKNIGKKIMAGGSKVKKNSSDRIRRVVKKGLVKKKHARKKIKSQCKDVFGHMNR